MGKQKERLIQGKAFKCGVSNKSKMSKTIKLMCSEEPLGASG